MSRAEVERVFTAVLAEIDGLLAPAAPDAPAAGGTAGGTERADVVADFLTFLAGRMTELHERRRTEMHSFLAWLEERIGCPLEDLAGKTAVLHYDEQPGGADSLLDVLVKNHPARVKPDLAAPAEYGAKNAERELIRRGCERSLERLRPIRREIELTDRLIDRIVYRLYGLTEKEVALVERGG
ncbi:MAG TPA: hypothetical protein VF188_17410 [Longimicrobiales bacterium]